MLAAACLMAAYLSMSTTSAVAQSTPASQMEPLTRGLIAMPAQGGGQFVSWRLLGTDPMSTSFDLLRDGQAIVADLRDRTSYTDLQGSSTSQYQVVTKVAGVVVETSEAVTPQSDVYRVLQLDRPADGTDDLTGNTYSYTPNDASVGDVDGDGEYEIIVQWQPSNKTDNGTTGWHPGTEYIDCYRLDGTKLWRLDMGINILAGDHQTQMLVYDFDRDGRSEVILRTAPGTKDGQGRYVNLVADDDEILQADNNADWRSSSMGTIVGGQEYLTVFEGSTGRAIHTIFYNPNRDGYYGGEASGTVFNWDDRSGRKDYAATYGNRGNRFLAAVAWLDGADSNPSAVMCRGYYTRAYVWAVDFDGSKLKHKWLHASVSKTEVQHTDAAWNVESRSYSSNTFGTSDSYTAYGQGNHNLSVADVDGDGCDEIVYGGATIDHDGWLLYSTGLGHGDAIHVTDIMPDRPGLEVVRCCESSPYGLEIHDAATGEKVFHQTAGKDTGRCLAADIMGEYRGLEFWGAQGNKPRETATGEFSTVSETMPSVNFRIYWDGDLQDELFDGSYDSNTGIASPNITKWNGTGFTKTMIDYNGSQTCNSTKATPVLQADITGDWREELVMWNLDDPSQLNIISTNIPSYNRVPTLMHDHIYRMGVAWQNVSYNQPPHLGYYLPDADFSYAEETGEEDDGPETITPVLTLDFEEGEVADYFAFNNEGDSLVVPSAAGSTGRAATIIASMDRGDYVKTNVELEGVKKYMVEMDLLPQKTSRTTQFAVLSLSSWDSWTKNYGIFWKTSKQQEYNPTLFSWSAAGGSTTAQLLIDHEGNYQQTWEFTADTWYHLTLEIDADKREVSYRIAEKVTPNDPVVSGSRTLPEGESPYVKGIYERGGRYIYEPGAIAIDNVVVSVYEEKTPEPDFVTGDANGDGQVTITDAVAIVNSILGNSSAGFNEAAADVNGDGNITITDAVGVVNIILQ